MANLVYIQSLVDDLAQLMAGIATRSIILAMSPASNEKFRTLRKRLCKLTQLLGSPPSFLDNVEDGWGWWDFISSEHYDYHDRTRFVQREFTDYYTHLFQDADKDPAELLIQRDLELVENVGEGGSGQVWRARHLTLNVDRAVKLFNPMFYQGEPDALLRFAREAELLSRVRDKNIVQFYDASVVGNSPYIVTEYIHGETIDHRLKSHGAFSPADACAVGLTLLDAVQVAHSLDILHRDIKPSNVMLDGDRVVLVDFGAGNALATGLTTSRLTAAQVGTPGYIAPEILKDPLRRDPRSDLYSVGVTLHQMVTLSLPFPGDGAYHLAQAGLDPKLYDVILRAMGPLEARFETAHEMADALRNASA